MTNSLYRRALLATTIIAGCGYAGPAFAQDETPEQAAPSDAVVPATAEETEEGATPEEIVVTGSRIARPNLDSSVPVVSITDEQIEAQGAENLADVAQTLPQFAPSFGGGRTTSSFSGTAAFGLNTANLRNLGAFRTLTLINGRRVPGGTSTTTSVDFNTLPTANIERLEVITGGQSATYGADAVTGVVNIITKSNFRGLEVGGSYGIAEDGHNENPNIYAIFGTEIGDGGHAVITAQYTYEGEVKCRDVWICSTDIRYTNPAEGPVRAPGTGITGIAPLSGVVLTGNFFIGATGQFTRDPVTGALIPFSAALPATFNALGYNRNPQRTLAIPTRRIMFAAEASYPLFDNAEAFMELNYGSSHTEGPIEPIAFQTAQQTFGVGPAAVAVTIPTTNPFFIAATTPAQRATLTAAQIANGINWGLRMPIDRGSENRRNTIRAVAGLRGDYSLFGNPWNWEAYYIYGRTETELKTLGTFGTDRLYYGLRVEADPANPGGYRCTDAGARATGCIPINPFLPLTQNQLNYLLLDVGQGGVSELNNAVAYTTGELFQLPYGAVQVAVGGEIRAFSGGQSIDEPIRLGITTTNQLQPTAYVKTKTHEIFAEVVVPVLKDLPGAKSLELEGAIRHTESNRSDSYQTWKFGGTYEPVDGVRFRAIKARAVRAPTPGELGGGGQTFGSVTDPCADVAGSLRQTNTTVAANCLADGVPVGYNPPLVVTQGTGGLFGGNPALEPEESDTLTYGVVLTPRFMPGFSLTVDRFAIDIDGLVNTVGRQTKANLCYTTTDRQFCEDIFRGFRPEINGDWALVGINDQLLNISVFELRGIDFEARYNTAVNFGFRTRERLALSLVGTYYDRAEQTEPTGVVTELDGAAGGDTSTQGYLRWQANGNINYSNDLINFNWNMRYIPKTRSSHLATHAAFPKIPDALYHNLRLGFDIAQRMEFYVGVNNALDKRPPIFPDNATGSQAQNTVAGFYDIFGRSYYAGAKVRF